MTNIEKTTSQALVAADQANAEVGQSPANQFVLVVQDNPFTGELDVAGVQRPQAFDPKSPAHRVGKFIQDHLELIVRLAGMEATGEGPALLANTLGGDLPPGATVPQLLLPSPKNLIVPGNDSLAVSP